MKFRYFTATHPWSVVKGPMGAMMAVLDDLDWNPISPFKWIDDKGFIWGYTPDGPTHDIIHALVEMVQTKIWEKTAGHQDGQGLQGGADITVVKKHLKHLKAKGLNSAAGLLLKIAA